jgi:hypothetical protein
MIRDLIFNSPLYLIFDSFFSVFFVDIHSYHNKREGAYLLGFNRPWQPRAKKESGNVFSFFILILILHFRP